jgi:Ca2+-binding EF-hand superfamily protein
MCTCLLTQAIDQDGGGNLSRQEVKFAFIERLKILTEKEADALVAALDKNRDYVISWDEFKRVLTLQVMGTDVTKIKYPTALHR